uniref:DNA helicase n=1 Tax=Strongyloides venezuelensis TaxID=75913 RepID=A0A0K0F3I0_STRVS
MSLQSGGRIQKQTKITDYFGNNSKDIEVIPKKRCKLTIGVQNDECKSIEIVGVTVRFPGVFDLYPSQISIMEAIIRSFENSTNALIESPTGSGKTIALLSSSIGWLKTYKSKVKTSIRNCKKHGNTIIEEIRKIKCNADRCLDVNDNVKDEEDHSYDCTCMENIRIYYATRTHKQIAQVIKELKQLPYCYTNTKDSNNIFHTILSAKEHSCANPDVKLSKNIYDKCKRINLSDTTKCTFKKNLDRNFNASNITLINNNLPVWDIEDFNVYGTEYQICPHFAALKLFEYGADIVFCPFNYIIDPKIRDKVRINLKNSIVILDEAHNMEGCSLASSSFSFTEEEIINSLSDLSLRKKLLNESLRRNPSTDIKKEYYGIENIHLNSQKKSYLTECLRHLEYLLAFMNMLSEWFKSFAPKVLIESPNVNTKSKIYQASEIMESLIYSELIVYQDDPLELEKLKKALVCCSTIGFGEKNAIFNSTDDRSKVLRKFKISTLCIECIEKFMYFMHFLVKSPSAYVLSYSIAESNRDFDMLNYLSQGISQCSDSFGTHENTSQKEDKKHDKDHITVKKYERIKENRAVKLDLWCLDPSLCFNDAFHNVRSVILASGTLSPIKAFVSELGTEFESIIQGDPTTPKEQIFSSVIGVGPNNRNIFCTKNMISFKGCVNGYSVLLEIASLIVDVCENVAKGVLVFFPSYSVLEQVVRKLNVSKLINRLKGVKLVLQEPRKSNDLDEVMRKYQKAIKQPESISKSCTGSVLFAVFRGKFSEGIDFGDDLARCVISIGIPYPNFGDPRVQEKRDFNDRFHTERNLLPGDEWYEIGAYRALNQALGRCLRHRNDWGVIIMVDKRLAQIIDHNLPGKDKISKWIVDNIKSYNNYETFIKEMKAFVKERNNTSSN